MIVTTLFPATAATTINTRKMTTQTRKTKGKTVTRTTKASNKINQFSGNMTGCWQL